MSVRAVIFGVRQFASSAAPQAASPRCAVVNQLLATLNEGIQDKKRPSILVESVKELGKEKINDAIRDLPPERTKDLWSVSGCWKAQKDSKIAGLMLERILLVATSQGTDALQLNKEALLQAVGNVSIVTVQKGGSV